MTVLEGIILGIVQGLTEFLPVSSSGHIELGKAILGVAPEENMAFTVAVHGATVLSTMAVFWREILRLLQGLLRLEWNRETRYIVQILVSMLPVGLVGLLLKDQLELLFAGSVLMVGCMLLHTALLLVCAHFAPKGGGGGLRLSRGEPTLASSLIMGLGQALAVVPGLSRSGTTISLGLLSGVSSSAATEFSFLMVLPPIIGMNLLELLGGDFTAGSISAMPLLAGSIAAFVSGYIACRWMLHLVRRGKLLWFALYCAAAGSVAIIYGL
ncbi:MAG: UDP-diphosphatase [Bacteroidia bacterium]|nr:MAG: UDP-diphosphatase [Bacteroidia bacterium]